MNLYILIDFFFASVLIALIFYLYIWVFEIENNEKEKTTLLGLENMSIENYLIEDSTKSLLLTFYDKLETRNPYIDINYLYTTQPSNLVFGVTDKDNTSLDTSSEYIKKITNNGETFIQERIYFKNVTSDYYRLIYTLDNSSSNQNNIKILRLLLKI